jgi:hypothetical protein
MHEQCTVKVTARRLREPLIPTPHIRWKPTGTKPAHVHEGHAKPLSTRGLQAESCSRKRTGTHPDQTLR